jgi:hypothetical protein
MSAEFDAEIAQRIKAKDKPERPAPRGIDDKLLELKGIGELLGHLCDRANDDFSHTFYFLSEQVTRLVNEIEDLYAAECRSGATS